MSTQLAEWTGEFGVAYLERNQVDPASRAPWFRHTLRPLRLESVLEVGCNRGHNLHAIEEALGQRVLTFGVEPSETARRQADNLAVMAGDIYGIPIMDGFYDLAFTSGVLIHVPPERLDQALREMHRVARRYLLAIEYFAEQDTEVEYRGLSNMLWKRDYGAHYLRLFPDLILRGMGDLTAADGFDEARYWLLEKPGNLNTKGETT